MNLGTTDEVNSDGDLLTNSVVEVRWKKIATDTDGSSATYLGKTKLTAVDVSSADFINYNSITEAKVLEWVKNSLGPADINIIDKTLEKKIQAGRVRKQTPNW